MNNPVTYMKDLSGVFALLTNDLPGQTYLHEPNVERLSLAVQQWYTDRYDCPFYEGSLRMYLEPNTSGFIVRFEDAITRHEWVAPFTFPLCADGFEAGITATHEEIQEYLDDMEELTLEADDDGHFKGDGAED